MMRLLLVDDEKYTREGILGDIPWEELGIEEIFEAKNGQEAFELATAQMIDILLTDVRMPLMNGIDLAYKVQALYPDCRIIFMSGFSDKAYLKAAIELNAVRYIEKPLDLEELQSALSKSVRLLENERKQEFSMATSTSLLLNNLCLELSKHQTEPKVLHALITQHLPRFPLEANNYQTILIKKVSGEGSMQNLLTPLYMKGFLAAAGLTGIFGYKDETHILIHLANPPQPNMSIGYELRQLLDTYLENAIHYVLVFGPWVDALVKLPDSYQHAVITSKQSFIQGHTKVLLPNSLLSSSLYNFNETIFLSFKQDLKNQDFEHATSAIKRLGIELKHQGNLLEEQIKSYYFHFLVMMNALDEGILDETQDFFTLTSLDLVEAYILQRLEQLKNKNHLPANLSPSCQSVLTFIHTHYNNSDISLTDISEAAHLSLSHMCVLFKKEMDTTVNYYLNAYRIKQSLPLLLEDDVKLHYVAYQVGFKDGNYYAKLFKKMMGLTPTAYRETLLHAQLD